MAGSSISLLTGAVIFLISVAYVQKGQAIMCWECNSKHDRNCGEPFKNHTPSYTDCSQRYLEQDEKQSATVCRKITQRVASEKRIIRACGFYNPEAAGQCTLRAGTHQIFMDYCQCNDKDGCNMATALRPFGTALLMIVIFVMTLSYSSFNSS